MIATENHFIISLDSVGWQVSSGQFCSTWYQHELQPPRAWLGWDVQDGSLTWLVLAVGVGDLLGAPLRLLPRGPGCDLSMWFGLLRVYWLGSERFRFRLRISRNQVRSCILARSPAGFCMFIEVCEDLNAQRSPWPLISLRHSGKDSEDNMIRESYS